MLKLKANTLDKKVIEYYKLYIQVINYIYWYWVCYVNTFWASIWIKHFGNRFQLYIRICNYFIYHILSDNSSYGHNIF